MEGLQELKAFYAGKRVFVTGHTGFKGAWLCQMLKILGAQVTGYALEPPTEPSLFDAAAVYEDMDSHIGDIRDLSHVQRTFAAARPEIVIHMAAQPIVRTSYEEPVYTYETNVMGTVHILECIRGCDSIRSVVNVTTDKVYDNKEKNTGYVEEDILDGYDPYSNSKSCSELVTHSYVRSFLQDRGIAVSTARAGNVIGGGDFARDRIIPDCFRAAMQKKEVNLRNPSSIRPYQHVLEPLYIYLVLAKRQWEDPKKYAGCYNVGPNPQDCIQTGQLVKYFAQFWGEGFSYTANEQEGPHEAGFLMLDCTKLKSTIGWKPRYTVEQAVEATVRWFRAYVDGEEMKEFCICQIQDFFS